MYYRCRKPQPWKKPAEEKCRIAFHGVPQINRKYKSIDNHKKKGV
jgi:hypothetical protein